MDKKPTVLLTNDDGFYAEGIRILYEELIKKFSVTVVAPEQEKSGVGHAFTFNNPLHYIKSDESDFMKGFIVNGTPADCVKFAISYLLPQRPDIVVSGMNNGEILVYLLSIPVQWLLPGKAHSGISRVSLSLSVGKVSLLQKIMHLWFPI